MFLFITNILDKDHVIFVILFTFDETFIYSKRINRKKLLTQYRSDNELIGFSHLADDY